jgi:hypothetical protein
MDGDARQGLPGPGAHPGGFDSVAGARPGHYGSGELFSAGGRPMTMIPRALLIAAAVSLAGAAGPGAATAQDEQGFQMPSHNVFCIVEPGDGGQPTDLRCDIQQMTSKPPRPPKTCPLSWGDAFAVTQTGAVGFRVCHGDTTRNDDLPVLDYGRTWRANGFSCQSATAGVRCVNAGGHGFMLSRAVQQIF